MNVASQEVCAALAKHKIVTILRNVDAGKVLPVAHALHKGGIKLLEITFNQNDPTSFSATAKAIQILAKEFQGEMLVGAGTVMTKEQCHMAVENGGKFILAPNTNAEVIQLACELEVAAIPGAMTPTEIAYAYQLGASVVKVFPAGMLGTAYIKAVRAPVNNVPLLAVGGINAENFLSFIKAGAIGVGIGANIANEEMIRHEDYAGLTRLALQYTAQLEK